MAETNKIRFLLVVSLMIFPALALDVILSSAHGIYDGRLNQLTYQTQSGTTKVIVYIIGRSRIVEIIRNAVRETRLKIARELRTWRCELVFLGIENFNDDEFNLISSFMGDKIQSDPQNQINLTIESIGEGRFDHFYQFDGQNFSKYQENDQICRGSLLARLRSIPRGALKPVEKDSKIIKLYEHQPLYREVTWSITVENDTYIPNVDLSVLKYNLKLRHPDMNIHLVIIGGKEYSTFARYAGSSPQMVRIKKNAKKMLKNKEVLIIMGVFNFDWVEIDILSEIILCHTMIPQDSNYSVYTCGVGMFNTVYSNMRNDGRYLPQVPNSNVADIIEALLGEEVKQRFIDIHYSDNGWQYLKIPITLVNGRYLREGRFNNFSFSWSNRKIAFIVYESTERNNPIDYSKVWRYVKNLKLSGIDVVVIETTNFEWYDAHIIAEWIDLHKGNVNSDQIAVLGGGTFDTIFQSANTTYNTLFNFKNNDLRRIRNTFVKSGNGKRIFAAKIDDSPNFEVWSYPMNTINGFYEPDLIPDRNSFNTIIGMKMLFIITSAHNFHRISAVDNVGLVVSAFRQRIKEAFPIWEWSVSLVCLDNFKERDSHLFAELVGMRTNYVISLQQSVRTFNYGINQTMYQYKDTAPFASEMRPQIVVLIETFFESILITDH